MVLLALLLSLKDYVCKLCFVCYVFAAFGSTSLSRFAMTFVLGIAPENRIAKLAEAKIGR